MLMLPLLLWMSAPVVAEQGEPVAQPQPETATVTAGAAPSQFIFTADAGPSVVVLFPAPSVDLSAFVGATLPAIPHRRPLHWTALGVRVMGSYGVVLPDTNLGTFKGGLHMHVAFTGAAGRQGRLAYSAGFGPVFGLAQRVAAHPKPVSPYGVEVEARIGYLFGGSASRVRGIFGWLFRFTTQISGDYIMPAPLIGAFLGMAIVPR
jgi:hypothetical protein